MGKPSDLIQGTLDLLILRLVANEPLHGWAIAEKLRLVSNEVLLVRQGALYPALHRLEQQGWIAGTWGKAENGREVKLYGLTREGKKELEKQLEQWTRLSGAVNLVIDVA
jgi:transcriptional regulator